MSQQLLQIRHTSDGGTSNTLYKCVQALGPWKLEVSSDRGNEEPVERPDAHLRRVGYCSTVLYRVNNAIARLPTAYHYCHGSVLAKTANKSCPDVKNGGVMSGFLEDSIPCAVINSCHLLRVGGPHPRIQATSRSDNQGLQSPTVRPRT